MGPIRENPDKFLGKLVKAPNGDLAQMVYWDVGCEGPHMEVGLTYITPSFMSGHWFRKRMFYDKDIDKITPLEG